MNKTFEKILDRLEETDFNDIQMTVREVLLKYGFPYESVIQDEVWDALDELSTNKFAKRIVQEVAQEYNDGWIPCSLRLPEEAFGCLVTVMDCEPSTQTDFENILPYFVGYDGHRWNDANGEEIPFEVIAWQPLPNLYQPKGE